MTYQVKFNDITSMQGQTNQTIQQWGVALNELQKSIALLSNNSELQGKAMTSAKSYMEELYDRSSWNIHTDADAVNE